MWGRKDEGKDEDEEHDGGASCHIGCATLVVPHWLCHIGCATLVGLSVLSYRKSLGLLHVGRSYK
jgi:hypothetical protein